LLFCENGYPDAQESVCFVGTAGSVKFFIPYESFELILRKGKSFQFDELRKSILVDFCLIADVGP